jgi:hypothetical protein
MSKLLKALWRPLTAVVMAIVALGIARGWWPAVTEQIATEVLTFCATIIGILGSARAVQRVQEVWADAAVKTAEAKAIELLPVELRAAADDPQLIDRLAENLAARLGMPPANGSGLTVVDGPPEMTPREWVARYAPPREQR